MTSAAKAYTILYFAQLAAEAGISEEKRQSQASNLRELYQEIQAAHQLSLEPNRLRPARNHQFCDWDSPLEAGDIVAFIPPISGG